MTLSADTIIYSPPLTTFSVTGNYEVQPGVLRNKMSKQHSTWIEMALEDGRGGSVGRWRRRVSIGRWHWAAVEDCSGGVRQQQQQKNMQQ